MLRLPPNSGHLAVWLLLVVMHPLGTLGAPITADFGLPGDLGQPDLSNLGSAISSTTDFATDLSDAVRETLDLNAPGYGGAIGAVFDVAEAMEAVERIAEVSNATNLEELSRAAAGIDSWDPYFDHLDTLRQFVSNAARRLPALSPSQLLPGDDLPFGVVLYDDTRSRAIEARQALIALGNNYGNASADLRSLLDAATAIRDRAARLSAVSGQVATAIAEAGLGGLFYPQLVELFGNVVTLDELSRSAADVEADASSLLQVQAFNQASVGNAIGEFNAALARPMVDVSYTMSAELISSPSTRCGLTSTFSPNNFAVSGLGAIPRFVLGSYAIRLTALVPTSDPSPRGCQGTIAIGIERTISGLPSLGTVSNQSSDAIDYFYSVDITGFEDMYLLSLVQTLDFQGQVGEDQAFVIWGSIESPLQILEVTPDPTSSAPPVIYQTTQQEMDSLTAIGVPEPSSGWLLACAIGTLFLHRRSSC